VSPSRRRAATSRSVRSVHTPHPLNIIIHGLFLDGAITFGGVDTSLVCTPLIVRIAFLTNGFYIQFTGEIHYHPITTTFPSSFFWGVNVTASYGSTPVISESVAGIVDTGTTRKSSPLFFFIFIYLPTTVILLADDFFDLYQSAIPGSYVDTNNTGLFVIPEDQVKHIKSFNFKLDGKVYTLDAAAQLVPQDQNAVWGGVAGVQYGYFGPLGSLSGSGLDFIIGQKFMERFYAVRILSEECRLRVYLYNVFFYLLWPGI
jgi:Eukaryotic aspartyl protease